MLVIAIIIVFTFTKSFTVHPLPIVTPSPSTPTIRVNDSIVGDPLFSVPLNLVNGSELLELKTLLHLCYEIHGRPDTYFNLVSDECTNINAYYTGVVSDTIDSLGLNIITQIGVRAIDSLGNCVRVRISTQLVTVHQLSLHQMGVWSARLDMTAMV